MDLVPAGQDVGDGLRRRVVGDGGADDVDDEAMVALGGDAQLGVAVEAAAGGEVDVAAEDGDAHAEIVGERLQAEDEVFALGFVVARGVVVVEVVEQVDFAVELVEEAAGDAEACVQDFDGRDERGGEERFEPGEAGVGDGDAEEEDQVLDGAGGGGELGAGPLEDEVVGGGVVDLVAGSLGTRVDADEGDAGAEAEVEGAAELGDVGAGDVAKDEVGGGVWFVEGEDVFELGGVGAWAVGALAVRGLGRVGGEG